jgi:hypothetical protein
MTKLYMLLLVSIGALGCSSDSPPLATSAQIAETAEAPRPAATNVSLRVLADEDDEQPVANVASGGDFVVQGEFLAVGEGHPSTLTMQIVNDKNVVMDAASAKPTPAGDSKFRFSAALTAPSNAGKYRIQSLYQQKPVAEKSLPVR